MKEEGVGDIRVYGRGKGEKEGNAVFWLVH